MNNEDRIMYVMHEYNRLESRVISDTLESLQNNTNQMRDRFWQRFATVKSFLNCFTGETVTFNIKTESNKFGVLTKEIYPTLAIGELNFNANGNKLFRMVYLSEKLEVCNSDYDAIYSVDISIEDNRTVNFIYNKLVSESGEIKNCYDSGRVYKTFANHTMSALEFVESVGRLNSTQLNKYFKNLIKQGEQQ